MKKINLALAFGCVALAPLAIANAGDSPYYVGVSGAASMVGDVDANNGRGAGGEVKTTADFDTGFGVKVRAGKQFSKLRGELELGYLAVDIDSLSTANGAVTNSSGDADVYTLMANGIYDFEMDAAVTPYVMAGVGIMRVDADASYTDDNGRAKTVSGDGTTIAGQVGVGVSYGISSNVDLVGGYSLMGAPTGETGEDEIITIHTAQIGINYNF